MHLDTKTLAGATLTWLAMAACGSSPDASGTSQGTGGAASSVSTSDTATNASSGATSTSTGPGASSSGAGGGAGGNVAWAGSIPAAPGLGLVDIAVGPTGDVVVADVLSTAFDQHRWSSAGAVVSAHSDPAGAYTGAMFTSGLFIDPGNDAFYATLMTGPQGSNTAVELAFTRLDATGNVSFRHSKKNALPTAGGPPAVNFLQVGGDDGDNLHCTFAMAKPEYISDGVYCYVADGSDLGGAAQNVSGMLVPQDFVWPSSDNELVVFKALSATTDLGCGAPLTVPAAGGVALAKFQGSGGCDWNKLLALPTAAVEQTNFRLGKDSSMLAAVVFSGTIDFGGGPLASAGTNSLALARFDANGSLVWSKSFGGAGSSFTVGSVDSTSTGDVILTGGYQGTVDLGGGALPGNADTFLAVFDAAGQLSWSSQVTVGGQGKLLAAAHPNGIALATNSPSVDFGGGPLSMVANGVASIGVALLGK